jgi:hypothetical protein
MRDLVRVLAVLIVVLAVAAPAAADTLYGVVFENTGSVTERLQTIGPVTGALTPVGGGIAGCCLVPSGVSTLDPVTDRFYFIGSYQTDPGGTSRIFTLALGTGAVLGDPVLPAANNYNFIEVDRTTGTLYGVVFDTGASTERLVTIDPTTAAVTTVGASIAGCCLVPSGTSALDPGAGVFYFFGAYQADPPGTSRIFTLALATGAVVSDPILAAGNNENFLEVNPATGTLYAVVFETATTTERLVTIAPATGVLTPVGAGIAGCCLVSSGVSTIDENNGVFYFVGFYQAEPSAYRIFGLSLATGAVLNQPLLPSGFNYNFIEFDPTLGPPPPAEVQIDIKPGSFPNAINPRSKGVIPVAVLSTPTFDALTVDVATVRFSGPAGPGEAHGKGHPEDVNGDGLVDLVLHFSTPLSGIQCGDTVGTLVGSTLGGDAFVGTDSIVTVGCD